MILLELVYLLKKIECFFWVVSTNIVNQMLQIQNPTIVVQAGDVARIPVPEKKNNKQDIENLVEDNISISKEDWDSFETSWDFKVHPLV